MSESLVVLVGYDEGDVDVWLEESFDFFGLDFYASGADDVVGSSDDAEALRGVELCYIVGYEGVGAYGGGVYDEA